MITALIYDERRNVREKLLAVMSALDSVEGIETVASAPELLTQYATHAADLVLIGTQRALTGGIEAMRRLLAAYPTAAVVVFGAPDDGPSITSAISAGARGFLRWDATGPELLTAIAETLGSTGQPRGRDTVDGQVNLTDRELQVLRGMSLGQSNGEIGQELFLSEDTIKTHARRLFKKLGARDRAHAVAVGFRRGLVG